MRQKIKYIMMFVFAFFSCTSFSQNFNTDIKNLSKEIEGSNECQIKAVVKTYGKKDGKLIYSSTAEVFRKGGSSINTLGEMQFIEISPYHIRIDHEEKAILIIDNSKVSQSSSNFDFSDKDMLSIQEALNSLQNQSGNGNNIPNYSMILNNKEYRSYSSKNIAGIKEVVIKIDYKRNTLKSISYEYGSEDSPGNYVEIIYTTFSYSLKDENIFDLKSFFTIKDGVYHLSKNYADYHLYTEL